MNPTPQPTIREDREIQVCIRCGKVDVSEKHNCMSYLQNSMSNEYYD